MSLHKLINLHEQRAWGPRWTSATSTASDACHQTLRAPHGPALHQAPCGWVRLVIPHLLPKTQLLNCIPHSSSQFKLTLKACHFCVAEFRAPLLTLSAWIHPHQADGKKRKSARLCALQETSQFTGTATIPQSFCAWFTHKMNYSQTCKWQHQDLFAVNKTQPR